MATGSFNRSGLNYQAGARTPLAAAFAGILLMGIVVLVAPLAAYLPNAAMAGILFMVAYGLVDFDAIKHILHSSKRETAVLAVTFFGALFLELETAIFAGIILSLILYLEKVSHPVIVTRTPDPRLPNHPFSSDPDLPQCPQIHFLRIDGSLFFGSINHVQEAFDRLREEHPEQKHLAVICQGINFADVAGCEALVQEAEQRRAMGGALYLIHVKKGLWDALEDSGALDAIGPGRVFQSKTAAIHALFQKVDKDICKTCDKRIFRECAEVPREDSAAPA